MGCLGLILPLLIALPIIFVLIFFNIITVSFGELGLSPATALALVSATLIGSMINIPVSRRKTTYEQPLPVYSRFLFYMPPRVTHQVIAVNVGGAIIPTGFALYLLPNAPLVPTLITIIVVALAARFLSRIVTGVGIVMPAWIAPLISAGLALLLARDNPAPVAYISGTVGVLIGADLLNWRNFKKLGSQMISIGGAGVFDGIFLAGIAAVFITSL
jgi:uncharacterized membrane protein